MKRLAHRCPGIGLALMVGAVVTACGPGVRVQSPASPRANLPGQTYSWVGGSDGVDGEMLLAGNPGVDGLIRTVIDAEMEARGFSEAESGAGSFGVAYAAALERTVEVEEVNDFFRYRRTGYLVSWDEVTTFDLGSLVLDISDPSTGSLIWRGVAEADLHRDDREYRESKLREGVRALLDELVNRTSGGE